MEPFIILIISMAAFLLFFFWRLLISPLLTYHKFCKNGLVGPPPNFPLGNMGDMKMEKKTSSFRSLTSISNDFHSSLFPYFARWQKLYGKVFLYWLGTEPFLYVADPEFVKRISADVIAKNWGKPDLFKRDRKPMFGEFGLVMTEGDVWVRHRQNITPAFSPPNLKAMTSLMVETASKMVHKWTTLINNGKQEIEVEIEIIRTTGNCETKQALTTTELVDECKTFFFGGHETTALALTWTLMLLAMHPEWQDQLREEIKEVVGDRELDVNLLARLRKVGWVFNETMRLYPPAPNIQRQTRGDIQIRDVVVPNGTNLWIDIVAIHHDPILWGDDVYEFKPDRFKDDIYGGCEHKMGYLPFGFGGRMCIGRNLTTMEYKIVLTLILSRFSFSLSPTYCHSPTILLSLRPTYGLPLIIRPLEVK